MVSYAEIGISVNEFLAPRWEKVILRPSMNAENLYSVFDPKALPIFFLLLGGIGKLDNWPRNFVKPWA